MRGVCSRSGRTGCPPGSSRSGDAAVDGSRREGQLVAQVLELHRLDALEDVHRRAAEDRADEAEERVRVRDHVRDLQDVVGRLARRDRDLEHHAEAGDLADRADVRLAARGGIAVVVPARADDLHAPLPGGEQVVLPGERGALEHGPGQPLHATLELLEGREPAQHGAERLERDDEPEARAVLQGREDALVVGVTARARRAGAALVEVHRDRVLGADRHLRDGVVADHPREVGLQLVVRRGADVDLEVVVALLAPEGDGEGGILRVDVDARELEQGLGRVRQGSLRGTGCASEAPGI